MIFREIKKDEIPLIWHIDRSEFIPSSYINKNGKLIEKEENFDLKGWPKGQKQVYLPILEDCYDRGGYFCAIFDNDKIIGVVVLESKFIGKNKDQLQLKFMHVDKNYRKKGLGKRLFEISVKEAKKRGANKLYISSCEVKNTVDFYMNLGCVLTNDVDEDLFQLEPNDIHLEYKID